MPDLSGTVLKGSGRRPRSVAIFLFALVLVILIPALAVTFVLIRRVNSEQEGVVFTLSAATVEAMGQSVEREISGMMTTLRVLSTDEAMFANRLGQYHQRAQGALAGSDAYLMAFDKDLGQIFDTRFPFGEKLPRTADAVNAQKARQRGDIVVSGLFRSPTTQQWVFNVWLPVNGEQTVSLIALTQNASDLLPILQTRTLPAGWNAALVDSEDKVIVATPAAGLAIGDNLELRQDTPNVTPNTASASARQAEPGMVVTAEWQSQLTGWRILAWASTQQMRHSLGESLLRLAAWGAIIAVTASIVAFAIAQRIAQSVRGLRLDAQCLGRGEVVPERHYPVAELNEISAALSQASRQRQAAERDVLFLMRELAHRSKNQMAVISAMAKQTARGATDLSGYVVAFERRIMGLARSTDLLLAHGRAGVSLQNLVDQQLTPFRPQAPERVSIVGQDIRINPQGAQILGMALHEMAVNAVQFGAFADERGQLSLTWEWNESRLDLTWRERLNSRLEPAGRIGFGTTVLRTMVGGALGAEVERTEHDDGVEWLLSIPLSALDPAFAAPRPDEDCYF